MGPKISSADSELKRPPEIQIPRGSADPITVDLTLDDDAKLSLSLHKKYNPRFVKYFSNCIFRVYATIRQYTI